MRTVTAEADLQAELRVHAAVLVLYGGPTCGVCTALRPRISAMAEQRFPKLRTLYVDCEASPELAAQQGVHTRPVVRVYFEGRRFVEKVWVFALKVLAHEIQRPYELLHGDPG